MGEGRYGRRWKGKEKVEEGKENEVEERKEDEVEEVEEGKEDGVEEGKEEEKVEVGIKRGKGR